MGNLLKPLALIALLAPASAQAQDVAERSVRYAREALRICIDTAAEPVAIRALAADEKWTPIDPASIPAKGRVVARGRKRAEDQIHERTSAWSFEKDGLALMVGLFDIPEAPRMRKQCELYAWDLDQQRVDEALKADPRVTDQSVPGFPVKIYAVPSSSLALSYLAGDLGVKVLHAFTAR